MNKKDSYNEKEFQVCFGNKLLLHTSEWNIARSNFVRIKFGKKNVFRIAFIKSKFKTKSARTRPSGQPF
jgi:hypothetical protein